MNAQKKIIFIEAILLDGIIVSAMMRDMHTDTRFNYDSFFERIDKR